MDHKICHMYVYHEIMKSQIYHIAKYLVYKSNNQSIVSACDQQYILTHHGYVIFCSRHG
jgi:hypothetical protein